jgi:hypothetical protein
MRNVFEEHPEIKSIKANREQIVAIIAAVNSPLVAASGRPLEKSRVWIIGVKNPSGLYSIYIYLHLVESNECQIFLHDTLEVSMDDYHDTELDALQFVESMGFMMENTNFRGIDAEQQAMLMERVPAFYQDLGEYAKFVNVGAEPDEQDNEELDVIELDELAEVEPIAEPVVSAEGLSKIVRLLSSF